MSKVNGLSRSERAVKLAKAIREVSWSQFRTMLEYKEKWYDKQVVLVSKTFAFNPLCSNGGYKNKDVKKSSLG